MFHALISLLILLADAPAPADLHGKVVFAEGLPISQASVVVYSAAPRKGAATMNPAEYPDCEKSIISDDQGAFTIAAVDSSLNFDLLVLADGYRPLMLKKVDPTRGEIKAKMSALPKDVEADHLVRGRVLDADGKPVVGASVEPRMYRVGNQRWYGGPDVERQTFTDAKGEFTLVCKKTDMNVDVRVQGRATAPMISVGMPQGEQITEVTVTAGATVSGRVTKDGQPLAGIALVLFQQNRNYEQDVGPFNAVTGDDGKFMFAHVGADSNYTLYATMKSMGDKGIVPATGCNTTADGTSSDVGDVAVEKGYTVSGKFVCSDDKPVPAGSKVTLSRYDINDSIDAKVDSEGKFELNCIPGEVVSFTPQVNGYHLSSENQSYEQMNARFLIGTVDGDITDLIVKLDPGPAERGTNFSNNWMQLRSGRLTGVPAQ